MTDIPTILNRFSKFLQEQLDPIDEPQETESNEIEIIENELDEQNRIPQSNVVVFWDYENIQIPKDADESLFFETLFPSSAEHRIIDKFVYAKENIIQNKLGIIEKFGFEYKYGVLSGKPNEIDHVLMIDCIDYCAKSKDNLIVVLMAGDVDYISLVEKLAENGHEVRIVCIDKTKISKSLQKIIPSIIDRKMIDNNINQLTRRLYTFSSIVNYLLSMEKNQSLPVVDLLSEIQKYYLNNINLQIGGFINLIQKLPDYNWQYRISNNIIQKLPIPLPTSINDPVSSRVLARKTSLYYKLGYEDNIEIWLETWDEYQKLEKNNSKLTDMLINLYSMIVIPQIRNYIQRELIKILLIEQKSQLHPSNEIFKNAKDIDEFIKNIHKRDKEKKKFTCKECSKTFQSKNSLLQHTNAVHINKKPPYLCPVCGKNLGNEKSAESHKRQAHNSPYHPIPNECNICYLRFSTINGLESHKSSKH